MLIIGYIVLYCLYKILLLFKFFIKWMYVLIMVLENSVLFYLFLKLFLLLVVFKESCFLFDDIVNELLICNGRGEIIGNGR